MSDFAQKKLNIDTGSLEGVGRGTIQTAAAVREIYTNIQNVVAVVTSRESWHDDACTSFLNKFNEASITFERDLQRLEDLGPSLISIANGYSDAEANNASAIH